jgi:hypothetical protein
LAVPFGRVGTAFARVAWRSTSAHSGRGLAASGRWRAARIATRLLIGQTIAVSDRNNHSYDKEGIHQITPLSSWKKN